MKKITLFLSAMLFSVMSFAGLGEGYTKVTDITTLAAGDKVVLYCDDAELGVTGWNGNKDATVAESGWVEYVVEVADGGFYLKDGEQYITGAESANHFKYGEKAVCGVNKDGVLACGTKFLYKNGDYYRMYTDKSSNNAYKPFYVYEVGEGGGETPDTPVDPEDPDTPEEPETPVGSIDGYSKVTNAASLVAGDKVVLYCDDAQLGVTGWNGNKDATVAESGWVEYVVEVADGGFYLKDGEQYITGAESANHFKYGEKAVCGVNKDGVLACGTKFLYKNGDYYRMYTDKSSNSAYKPFYVYKVGEGSGNTPGGETPETEVNVTELDYAMAFYEEEDGFAYWEIQLFNTDATGEYIEFPMAAVAVEAKSKTALNGTYDLLLALYGTGEDAEGYLDGVYMSEDEAGTLTIKNIDNEGTYSFVGSFVGEDGKTYKINTESFMMWVEDGATGDAIELDEDGGNTPVTPPAGGIVTFDADEDKGNATETQAEYQVAKQGVTMLVSSGRLGTFNSETHYRIYKDQTLTLTSTVGNIIKVEFTCTANDDAQYGPGCFTVADGGYSYSGAVGTWTGNAASVIFTASTAQVRASQIVVTLATETTGVEDVTTVEIPVKVMQNGQLMIISGENVYNILGAHVK